MKKGMAFMKKYPAYNATIHAIGGVGIGILIASSLAGSNLVIWGVSLMVISLLGHLYTWFA